MSMNKKIRFFLPHVLALSVVILPALAFAQGTFVPLEPISGGKLGNLYGSSGGDLSTFINKLFQFALVIGAVGAVLRLAYAGYLYMGQADMWSHKGQAKAIIGDVTLGLLLLLSIWLILYQINPDILTLNALKNIKPVQGGGQAAPAQGTPTDGSQSAIRHITGGGSAQTDAFGNSTGQ